MIIYRNLHATMVVTSQENSSSNSSLPIQKKVLHAGKGDIPRFKDGTKVNFHFVAKRLDADKTVLDDSRKWTKPMELIFGKKFKLESWEMSIETMRVGEVASFTTKRVYTHSYPIVAKTLRDNFLPKPAGHNHKQHKASTHMCGMMAMQAEGGLGYDDLNLLMKQPEDLEFIMELLSVQQPEDYEKENWQMDADEKLDSVPQLKADGNKMFSSKDYAGASEKYREALGRLEQLMLREKPGEEEWEELLQLKIPLLLNLSQCRLSLSDYYPVIEHCTEVLEKQPQNVKALYRRGKAHVGAWNPKEAKEDFHAVIELDPSLAKSCKKEIVAVELLEKEKDAEDKGKMTKLFN